MMNIELISKEIIKPSHPTPSHLVHLKSSIFKHTQTPILSPLIFFFSKTKNLTTSSALDRLKNVLPKALTVFYPLAGRIQNGIITCNDEGVPYVQAQSLSCLSEVVHKVDVSELDKLLLSYEYSQLLMAIQVTTFACGGLSVGLQMSPAISDAFSMAMFLNTWSYLANGESFHTVSPRPYFELWRQFPAQSTQTITVNPSDYKSVSVMQNRPVTKWFLFSKTSCDALRSKFCSDYNAKNNPSLTLVLSAFISARIKFACKNSTFYNNLPIEVFQAVNIRPKLKALPKPYYYFGSGVVNAIGKPRNRNISYLECMEKSIQKIIGSDLEINEEFNNGVEEELRLTIEHFKRKSKGEIVSFGFSSMRSLPMYEADFGWGKPVWVTSASGLYKDFTILISASASNQDICAFINLSRDEMIKLEADQKFLSFVSKSATFDKGSNKL